MEEIKDNIVVTGSPDEIWLVYGDIYEDAQHEECDDVTWCSDHQFDADVKYIRDDIVDKKAAELDALRKAITYLVDNINIPSYELEIAGLIDENGNKTKILTGE